VAINIDCSGGRRRARRIERPGSVLFEGNIRCSVWICKDVTQLVDLVVDLGLYEARGNTPVRYRRPRASGQEQNAENARCRKPRTPGRKQETENAQRWGPRISGGQENTQSPDPKAFRSARCSIYTRNFARCSSTRWQFGAGPYHERHQVGRDKPKNSACIQGQNDVYLLNGLSLQS